MTQLDGDRLWFAERPGNRRADSLRNIISQPNVAALLMIPGSRQVAIIKGNAMISTEESVRERFAIRGKTPALATSIDLGEVFIQESPSLARADLWPVAARPDGIDPAKIFVAHVKLNRGLQARLAGAIMSIPGLMQKGLDKDYETNLY
jgi:predicted pyridoxine 5'-phosphate oxidase superfamily flavin-nucleotide-binding protein